MEFLSEDPTYVAGGLGLLALIFLILLRITQQGKYLLWAGVALFLAVAVIGVEQVWVTDNERIEQVVYDLGKAVEASDAERVLSHMAPDVKYVQGGTTFSGAATRPFLRSAIQNTKFDTLKIIHLRTNAGAQSRRGTAEFQVITFGTHQGFTTLNFATTGSETLSWSLGFEETSPKVWKVNRISALHVPRNVVLPAPSAR